MTLSAPQRRMASLYHIRHIESLARQKAIGEAVAALTAKFRASIIDAATKPHGVMGTIINQAFATLVADQRKLFADLAEKMIRWSYRSASEAITGSVPLAWWKALIPILPVKGLRERDETGLMNKEDDDDDESLDPLGRIRRGMTAITNDLPEPIVRMWNSGKAMKKISDLVFPPPSKAKVDLLLKLRNPATGLNWRERIEGYSKKVADPAGIQRTISLAVSNGENMSQIIQRVDKFVGPLNGTSKMIARTEAGVFAEMSNRESWSKAGPLIVGSQIVAVLDENTRPEHAARHGTIYYSDGRQPTIDEMPLLPDAPNCRCLSVPVLRSPSDVAANPDVSGSFRNAKGDFIPEPAVYTKWFDRADVGRRKEVIGVARYNAMAAKLEKIRRPEWTDFITSDGKLLDMAVVRNEPLSALAARKAEVSAAINQRERDFFAVALRGFITPEPILVK